MYCITINCFINGKYERPEVYATKKQMEQIVELRNNPTTRDYLVTIDGSDFWFSPKDILFVNKLDIASSWWQSQAPEYFVKNYEKEEKK